MIKKEHKTTPHEEGPARRKPSSHRGGGRRAHRRTFQKERERERFFKIARFSLSLVSSFSSSLSYFGAYFLLLFRFFLLKNVCLRGPSLHQKEREREREREIPSHPSHPSRLSLFKKKKKMSSLSSSSALLVAKNEKVKATLRDN